MEKKGAQNKKIPDSPGVYFFLGARREILYIGKATSLRLRIKSYFGDDITEKRSRLIGEMMEKAKTVEWTVTPSVLEAMLLEVNLIRTHKPKFNTISKDDKSYNHLVITNEEFPRVLVVRAKDLTEKFTKNELKYVFGPFPSGSTFKDALKVIRKLFQFYDTKKPIGEEKSKLERGRINFNRQIGLFPEIYSKREYQKAIRHIKLFFEGKKKRVIKELKSDMMAFAKKEKFEESAKIKKRIFALEHIQDVALIKDDSRVYRDEKMVRIEAYDISHFAGKDMVGAMIVLEGGEFQKDSYRKFKIHSVSASNDTAALREVLERRLQHDEWPLPQLIVVDGGVAQKNVALRVLGKAGLVIPVVGVLKDERHKPKNIIGPRKSITDYKNEILMANGEVHRFVLAYHRNRRTLKR